MNSESASTDPENDFDKKRVGNSGDAKDSSSNQRVHINGMSNGYNGDHKSSHKDKHRDKDREHKHKSSSSKDKEKHRDKERSKDHKSSSRDKEKDRDKERSDKDKERTKDKEKHRDKDKHHDEKKSSKEHKSSSSSSKDKEHKSSSSSRDKDRERSEKDKDRGERDKDRSDKEKDSEKEKEKNDRDRHKYSSSKDKHSSSKDKDRHSSSKDKHHSKDKDRKDRDKHRDLSKSKSEKSSSSPEKKSTYSDNSDLDKKKHSKERMNCIKDDTEDEEEIAMPITAPVAIIKEEELDIKEEDNHESWNVNVSATSSCDYNLSAFKSEPEFDQGEPEQEIKQEQESGSDDDMPLASRTISPAVKRKMEFDEEDDDDDKPLFARKKVKKEKKAKKRSAFADDDDDDFIEKPKKKVKNKKEIKKEIKKEQSTSDTGSPKKRKKKEEEEQNVWKWWEEEKKDDGTKWNFLEHKGPVFAPPYEPLPESVKFFYDGKEMKLSEEAEEVAGFYARMLEHDYTTKDIFNNNFFKDWRKCMTEKERSKITDLKKCNFKNMHAYFMDLSEKNRNRTKEEKEELKKKNAEIQEEYGFCTIDGHKEKIGNFKIEPPGLFRGRGEHPKMGMLKRRVVPEDVLINCAKNSKIPVPPAGHKWKEVRHDPTVTWLASWTENVQNQVKYVMLNPSSKLKGEKDWQKYETARKLAKSIDKIRREYRDDWKSKEMRIRQRAVALYFIDKLALRAGNEKDEDQADTVGCCSLRVEHISLHEQKDGKEYVVVFDFLGKDSIRYYNEVPVEKRVFKNLQLFMENKAGSDDLFDRLNTAILNKHLNELMEGLTAKVFRTYNASWTLQQQLDELTNEDDSIAEKILSYNRANRAVAILCNHQRSVPKGHAKSMEKLKEKIDQKKQQIHEAERQVKDAQKDAKHGSVKEKMLYEKKKKMLDKMREQLKKLEVQETDRDENKSIALGTSKLNYLDPRISVAWCKKYDVPIEKIYNKTQRDKFRWAIDMAGPDYVF